MFKDLKKRFFKPTLGNAAKIISRMGDNYKTDIHPKDPSANYGYIQVSVGKYQSLRIAIDRTKTEFERNGFRVYRIVDDNGLFVSYRSKNIFIQDGSFNIGFVQEMNEKPI